MRDMANIYRNRTSDDLRTLRSKKLVRLQLLDSWADTWYVKRERDVLLHQVHQIDVELNARFLQQALF